MTEQEFGSGHLAVQEDDWKTGYLSGLQIPSIGLAATDGSTVDLAEGSLTVVYAYPRTSPAIGGALEGWDTIPGARGCTPQSCAFRDHFAELKGVGASGCSVFLLKLRTTKKRSLSGFICLFLCCQTVCSTFLALWNSHFLKWEE